MLWLGYGGRRGRRGRAPQVGSVSVPCRRTNRTSACRAPLGHTAARL